MGAIVKRWGRETRARRLPPKGGILPISFPVPQFVRSAVHSVPQFIQQFNQPQSPISVVPATLQPVPQQSATKISKLATKQSYAPIGYPTRQSRMPPICPLSDIYPISPLYPISLPYNLYLQYYPIHLPIYPYLLIPYLHIILYLPLSLYFIPLYLPLIPLYYSTIHLSPCFIPAIFPFPSIFLCLYPILLLVSL